VLDVSYPTKEGSAAALERLLLSVDSRLEVLQLMRGITEWSSSINPFDILDHLNNIRSSSESSHKVPVDSRKNPRSSDE
jgi:hypothetical protein